MIWRDRIKEARAMLKAGAPATAKPYVIKEMAWYLTHHTTYRRQQKFDKLKQATSNYFSGMPSEYIDTELNKLLDKQAASQVLTDTHNLSPNSVEKKIIIYQEELRQIETLNHEDTERLAFLFLVYAKYLGDDKISDNSNTLFRLAWRFDYNQKDKTVVGIHSGRSRVSGGVARKRITQLSKSQFISFYIEKGRKPSWVVYRVDFKRNDGEIAFEIDRCDKENIVLYYDYWKRYGNLQPCAKCGSIIYKSSNHRRYCTDCAEREKRSHVKKVK